MRTPARARAPSSVQPALSLERSDRAAMSNSIETLLADYADLEPFARQLNRHPRTVRRWMDEPNGLPFTRIGNRILIHVPTASEWIFGRMRRPNPQRHRRG